MRVLWGLAFFNSSLEVMGAFTCAFSSILSLFTRWAFFGLNLGLNPDILLLYLSLSSRFIQLEFMSNVLVHFIQSILVIGVFFYLVP